MSELSKLLEGVEVGWKPLGEVAELNRGKTITAKTKMAGNIPVISGGQTPAYYNSEYNRDGETITVAGSGAYAGFVMYWNVPIFVSDAFSVKPDLALLNTRYVFHFLLNNQAWIHNLQKGSGVPHVYPKDLAQLKIPIPYPGNPQKSLEIQKEIVRILDTFTERTDTLINELTTELEARKKQYNYYREKLLSFNCLNQDLQDSQNFQDKVEWKTLGEVAEIGTGSHNTQDAEDDGEYTFYARGITPLKLNSYDFEETAIITAGDGVGVGKVFHWVVGKYALHQRAYRIVPNEKEIYPRFVYHYIVAKFYLYIEKTSVSSSVTSMRKPMFLKFPIPVPSLKEQTRIVAILDKLDSLTTSISEALPKEIALRKKQYEYYRDRLLTFK